MLLGRLAIDTRDTKGHFSPCRTLVQCYHQDHVFPTRGRHVDEMGRFNQVTVLLPSITTDQPINSQPINPSRKTDHDDDGTTAQRLHTSPTHPAPQAKWCSTTFVTPNVREYSENQSDKKDFIADWINSQPQATIYLSLTQ